MSRYTKKGRPMKRPAQCLQKAIVTLKNLMLLIFCNNIK